MASGGSDPDAEYTLSKLLQMGTVAEYQNEFEMLIKRVTIPESLLKSFYISRLKLDLQCLLFRLNPSTLGEDFFKARITEARFEITAKEEKEHIVEKEIDVILPLQSEFDSPKAEESLNVDEYVGVEETTEEEIALAKGWKSVSENSKRGNARKKYDFWVEVIEYIESRTKMEGRQTYDMVLGKWKTVRLAVVQFCGVYNNVMRMAQKSGAGDKDYIQKAMIHYQAKTGLPYKFHHCWDVLKDSLKFRDITFQNLNEVSQGSNKRHKKFNDQGRDKARAAAKKKEYKASTSSTMNDDAFARLVVNEMTAAEVEQRETFIELKRREVECSEREIAATEYRAQQEDMKLYLQPYDHLTGEQRLAWEEIRVKIKAKYNLQF
ncbi:hypothetical protein Tco_1503141 [Tanacetum coccineum]